MRKLSAADANRIHEANSRIRGNSSSLFAGHGEAAA
jgi:hypothetical protein